MADRKILFDCLSCGRRYAVPAERARAWLTCLCGRLNQVPRRSTVGPNQQTLWDWLVARFVYGLAGALLGLVIAVVIVLRFPVFQAGMGPVLIGIPAVLGVLGLLGGEALVNGVGRMFRDGEEKR